MIRRRYPTVLEYVNSLPDGRNKEMLLYRLEGKTLDEVGKRFDGVTRERVRQIINKALEKRPWLYEDQYRYVYDTYAFSPEDFSLAFGEPPSAHIYLETVSMTKQKNRKPVDEAVLTDETIPVTLRKAVERVVYKNYVTLDGVRVKRDRSELVRHIIRTRCRTLTKYDDFVIMYRNVVEDLGLAGEERLALEPRTYENKLNGSRFVLWNQWRRFRYYNIDAQDYTELFATLDMEQYRDTELSSLKVFRDYPELMEQYDIHDEYELHNLLKKIWPVDAMPIRFPKMPTIEVGQVDRDAQVKALLFQCAPISGEAFAAKYEETYGIKAASAMANLFGCIEKYYYNGTYTVPEETLPADQTERMRRVLTEDFYSLRRARNLFLREFPDADAERLTPYALKTIGFHVYTDYIIRDIYASAAEYFRSVLTSGDVLDMRGSGKELQRVVAYNSELYSLRAAYKIVEFSPLQYVSIKRLTEHGVTEQTLRAYCEDVAKRYEPGEYFTVASLRADGFMHPLDDLGFDEWFYGSVLLEARELFSYQRIGGTRLFMRGNAPVRIGGLLTELLEHEQKADVYELRDTLEEHFGIVLPKDKLIELVKETDLYYDAIMLQFLQYKVFGRHRVPDGWIVVTAGNPPEYNNSVHEFDIVTWDRLKRIDVELDYTVWKEYAYKTGVHPAVTTYLDIKKPNFYKVESTVGGKRFVTARGWDDLSQMIGLYERNGIKVDELLVNQYLQNPTVAKDFTVYYDLFNKYRSDYQVDSILAGTPPENIKQRARDAKFDERLSLLGLLLDAIVSRLREVVDEESLTAAYMAELKQLRLDLTSQTPDAALDKHTDRLQRKMEQDRKAGSLSSAEQRQRQKLIALLRELKPKMKGLEGAAAFKAAKEDFDARVKALKSHAAQAGQQLSNVFRFCEEVFAEGQEMLILVTELTISYYAAKFISRYGCPEYFAHNKELLFYERQQEIISEIEKLELDDE